MTEKARTLFISYRAVQHTLIHYQLVPHWARFFLLGSSGQLFSDVAALAFAHAVGTEQQSQGLLGHMLLGHISTLR